jgi:tight adherence protein C
MTRFWWILAAVFALVMLSVTIAGLLFRRWQLSSATADTSGSKASPETAADSLAQPLVELLARVGRLLGGRRRSDNKARVLLFRAGYRSPNAPSVFLGLQIAVAVVAAVGALWLSMIGSGANMAGLTVLSAGAFGFFVPSRALDFQVRRRSRLIRRALPSALDLMVLATEAGQSLDQALQDTSRGLKLCYPELANELSFCQLEMSAGASRVEALQRLGERSGEEELKRLAGLMIDGERFGTSLGPALRVHARYLRTRMRQQAQESARKLGVKLVFPVFFLIFPSVLLVTLGPAYLQMREFFDKLLK